MPKNSRYAFLSAWALSLGCSVGWGAFVMPSMTLLPLAGPVGTVTAIVVGALLMGVVACNLHIMMNRIPGTGGIYSFIKQVFGYDHSFFCAWATALAYLAVLWANASAFVLIVRNLFGNVLQWGFHYSVAGYDVWLGEIITTLAIICLFGLVCIKAWSVIRLLNVVFALVLVIGVSALFVLVLAHGGDIAAHIGDGFVTMGEVGEKSHFLQVLNVVIWAPWAFVGFGAVTFATSDYKFKHRQAFSIMALALACGALVYVLLTLLGISVLPQGFVKWEDYTTAVVSMDGLASLPVFNATSQTLGSPGIMLLGLCLLAAISTSMIGLYRTMGRLLHSMAEDSVIPPWFAKTNGNGIPQNAILFVMLLSAVIPFIGRTTIGWIVDITSISASLVYFYVAAGAIYLSRSERGRKRLSLLVPGLLGVAISALFFFFPLVPSFWNMGILARESFLILMAWSIFGFFIFRAVFMRDRKNRFGKSAVMWLSMVFVLLISSVMWTREIIHEQTETAVERISKYHFESHLQIHAPMNDILVLKEREFIETQMASIRKSQLLLAVMQFVLIMLSLFIMFNVLKTQQLREKVLGAAKIRAEESNKAKTIFLSNMSHDIRTPMNAIIGYTNLARRPGTSLADMQKYLAKINSSNTYLLALINDVLEMSRIEIGKMELEERPCSLRQMMGDLRDMFETQMSSKNIMFSVDCYNLQNPIVLCDRNRLNRVLLNLVSNAFKFTSENGNVSVSLVQLSEVQEEQARYEIRVRDNGIGMSPEFAEHVFDAFERERVSTISGVQGTGLGMAIAKSIVDLMGGSIRVNTEVGEGSEFVVNLKFRIPAGFENGTEPAETPAQNEVTLSGSYPEATLPMDFNQMRILLVEDMDVNRELAKMILEGHGIAVETATNGAEAVEMVSASDPGHYSGVLMDIQMPVMDGYEATRQIRALPDSQKSGIPIVAMTANAFSEDVKRAEAAGMNAHVAKPIDVEILMNTISEWMG